MFSSEYCENFKNTYLKNICERLFLYFRILRTIFFLKNGRSKTVSEKSEISEISEKLFRVFLFRSSRFCPTVKIENSLADREGLRDHLRDVPWEDIFKLSAAAASEFCEWVQVGIDVYTPHRKYQVKPHSSL